MTCAWSALFIISDFQWREESEQNRSQSDIRCVEAVIKQSACALTNCKHFEPRLAWSARLLLTLRVWCTHVARWLPVYTLTSLLSYIPRPTIICTLDLLTRSNIDCSVHLAVPCRQLLSTDFTAALCLRLRCVYPPSSNCCRQSSPTERAQRTPLSLQAADAASAASAVQLTGCLSRRLSRTIAFVALSSSRRGVAPTGADVCNYTVNRINVKETLLSLEVRRRGRSRPIGGCVVGGAVEIIRWTMNRQHYRIDP